jgi:hypothetical protein
MVFEEVLKNYPKAVIQKAFTKAESELERFPTPKIMRTICSESMPSQTWRYDFEPSVDYDAESEVRVLIDPDPTCSICREPKSIHPLKKCGRYTPSGLGDDRVMFRPQDCPEGREFLLKLRKIAGQR